MKSVPLTSNNYPVLYSLFNFNTNWMTEGSLLSPLGGTSHGHNNGEEIKRHGSRPSRAYLHHSGEDIAE